MKGRPLGGLNFLLHTDELPEIRLLYPEVQDEQESGHCHQNMQHHHEHLAGKQGAQKIEHRKNQCAGGDRKAPVIFVAAGFHLLPLGLLDVEKARRITAQTQ